MSCLAKCDMLQFWIFAYEAALDLSPCPILNLLILAGVTTGAEDKSGEASQVISGLLNLSPDSGSWGMLNCFLPFLTVWTSSRMPAGYQIGKSIVSSENHNTSMK